MNHAEAFFKISFVSSTMFFLLSLSASLAAEETLEETFPVISDPSLGTSLTQITDLDTAVPSVWNLQENSLTEDPMAQMTSVSRLRDVSPNDWAYLAVQQLIERYNCLAGYPDGTFRGNRPLTRYEFAAGLSDCLQQYEREIIIGAINAIPKEELATIQRLQEEFALELALTRGDVDAVQARTGELELIQFSTTTQLQGLVFWNFTKAFTDGAILAEGNDVFRAQRTTTGIPVIRSEEEANTTYSYLAWLTLNTSFTGRDLLVTQLAAGNGTSPANDFASAGLFNTFGVPYTDQIAGEQENDLVIRELFYQFPVSDSLQVAVGPQVNWYRYFDDNRFTNILTGAGSYNSSGSTLLNAVDRGAGAVISWGINDQLLLNVGYLGEETEFLPSPPFNTASDPSEGLFGGTNTLTAELTYSPIDSLNLRFLYNRTNLQVIDGQVGGALGEPILGFADFPGSEIDSATADTFSFNFDWLVTPGFGLFGRYSYGSTNLEPINPSLSDGEINAQAFQVGVAFPDLFKEGALATLSYVVPFSVLNGESFLVSGAGDGGVQYEFEASYYYPISDRVALIPAFYWIGNVNNFSENPNLYIANLRAQFSF